MLRPHTPAHVPHNHRERDRQDTHTHNTMCRCTHTPHHTQVYTLCTIHTDIYIVHTNSHHVPPTYIIYIYTSSFCLSYTCTQTHTHTQNQKSTNKTKQNPENPEAQSITLAYVWPKNNTMAYLCNNLHIHLHINTCRKSSISVFSV